MPKKKTPKFVPVDFSITVDVDVHGNFKYSLTDGKDAKSIRPRNGDRISWVAKLGGVPVPFQIEFPGFSPFGFKTRSVRSLFGPTPFLKVAMPPSYHGNLVLKYSVDVANGWSDDPDVVPVTSDGIDTESDKQTVLLSINASTGDLVLTPSNATYSKGEVVWKWDGEPQDEFTLKFKAPVPPGWPPVTQSNSARIDLNLQTASTDSYTVETMNLGISAEGKLTIS